MINITENKEVHWAFVLHNLNPSKESWNNYQRLLKEWLKTREEKTKPLNIKEEVSIEHVDCSSGGCPVEFDENKNYLRGKNKGA